MAESLSLPLKLPPLTHIKQELIRANRQCSQRRLLQSAKWSAEMSLALDVQLDQEQLRYQERDDFLQEYDNYAIAVSYFDLKEYDRAAYFLKGCTSSKPYFLYMYSRYLADEKRKTDNASDSIGPPNKLENEILKTLKVELNKKHVNKEIDGYCLYLYGIVLKKLELIKEAIEIFIEAINREPLHWGAWQELALLITDKETLQSIQLPSHWMKHMFLAHVYLQLHLTDDAMKIYLGLKESGLASSTYIVSQVAVAYHNLMDTDLAMASFGDLQEMDPFRLENMDSYSNLLYIREMRAELANLAHKCCNIDKYREETCCVIGNYYSLRQQHEKAVLYFQRALKLNPHYLSAWTLVGHEFMELKNTSAALQAYRQAIEVDRRDYRAWYGLGQTYEILKMYYYCLYYYRQAQQLRPNDSRMVVALGETFEKLDRLQEAKKCFWKARCIGDMEGMALFKLGRLHEKLGEEDQAANAYTDYINEANRQGMCSSEDQSLAYKYLATYHLKRKQLDDAFAAAQKCTEFPETREEAKGILQDIQALRAQKDGHSVGNDMRFLDDSAGSLTGTSQRFGHGNDHTPRGRISPISLKFTP